MRDNERFLKAILKPIQNSHFCATDLVPFGLDRASAFDKLSKSLIPSAIEDDQVPPPTLWREEVSKIPKDTEGGLSNVHHRCAPEASGDGRSASQEARVHREEDHQRRTFAAYLLLLVLTSSLFIGARDCQDAGTNEQAVGYTGIAKEEGARAASGAYCGCPHNYPESEGLTGECISQR